MRAARIVWPLALLTPSLLMTGLTLSAAPVNWGGAYGTCDRHADLVDKEHVDLGVRLSTSNTTLARQFERAMEFWASIVDFDWHEVQSDGCAVQLVEGTQDLFESAAIAARAQEPDRTGFQGWVAFNPASKLTEHEMFVVSVHEIGHLLGLSHSQNASSVMFFFTLDDSVWLDAADLAVLAQRHTLRSGVFASGRVTAQRVITP